jgi:hypothetical protein
MIYINIPVKVHVKSVYFLTQGPNLQSADNDFTINFYYVSCIFTIHFCVPCVVHSTTRNRERIVLKYTSQSLKNRNKTQDLKSDQPITVARNMTKTEIIQKESNFDQIEFCYIDKHTAKKQNKERQVSKSD